MTTMSRRAPMIAFRHFPRDRLIKARNADVSLRWRNGTVAAREIGLLAPEVPLVTLGMKWCRYLGNQHAGRLIFKIGR